jgi:hypothetical protein
VRPQGGRDADLRQLHLRLLDDAALALDVGEVDRQDREVAARERLVRQLDGGPAVGRAQLAARIRTRARDTRRDDPVGNPCRRSVRVPGEQLAVQGMYDGAPEPLVREREVAEVETQRRDVE